MDEETTTNASEDNGGVQTVQGVAVDDQGQAIPQPEPSTETAAAEPDTSDAPDEPQDDPAPSKPTDDPKESDDDQLAAWARNKGLELDSDNATKAAKMAWNAERAMHNKARQKSELEKTLTVNSDEKAEEIAQFSGVDPSYLKRLQRVEIRDSVRDFYDIHPDARDMESAMITELQKRPHLAGDLEALYAVVKTSNLDAVKSQGRREGLESLAQKQQAAVPRGNAVTNSMSSNKITPQNVDQMVQRMSPEEYRRRLPEINRAMAG